MSNATNVNKQGVSFLDLLTILFIGLRLVDKIDWSWWLVLSPMAVQFILYILLILLTSNVRK